MNVFLLAVIIAIHVTSIKTSINTINVTMNTKRYWHAKYGPYVSYIYIYTYICDLVYDY